jgi:hypothetical protein
MKSKDFKNKLIAVFIMFMAFVMGMNAQNKNCSPRTCNPFQNPDLLQIYEAIKEDSAYRSGGGGGCRTCYNQETQDSIKRALYYTGVGSSIANLISENNSVLDDIVNNTNAIAHFRQSSLDSINKSLLQTTITPSYAYIKGGSGTIKAGARYISISNLGTAAATVNGTTLPAGITIIFPPVWNTVFSQMTYSGLSTVLLILQNR